jgi:hypoxanthine phosphoribosyltransferase
MINKFAALLNQFYSDGVARVGGMITVFGSVFGTVWIIFNTLGVHGSLFSFTILFIISAMSIYVLFLLAPLRWSILTSLLRSNLKRISKTSPDLIIGIGPGGAIIAGILAKLYVDNEEDEPYTLVINRDFEQEHHHIGAKLSRMTSYDLKNINRMKNILLVTSEVNSGKAITLAHESIRQRINSKNLKKGRVSLRTFSLIASPKSAFKTDYSLLVSDKRGLLPWKDSPKRK